MSEREFTWVPGPVGIFAQGYWLKVDGREPSGGGVSVSPDGTGWAIIKWPGAIIPNPQGHAPTKEAAMAQVEAWPW